MLEYVIAISLSFQNKDKLGVLKKNEAKGNDKN